MREERIVLEDGVDIAVVRRDLSDIDTRELDRAGGRLLEARDHAQHRRLARARGAEQGEELAVGDVEVDTVDRHHVAERLAQLPQPDGDAHLTYLT